MSMPYGGGEGIAMGIRVGVAGASGYAGGELLRLLLGHPEFERGPLSAGASAGGRVADTHPQLAALSDARFVATRPASSPTPTSCSWRCRTVSPPPSPRSCPAA